MLIITDESTFLKKELELNNAFEPKTTLNFNNKIKNVFPPSIPKNSMLINTDKNFRIKMSPSSIKLKVKNSVITPFQAIESVKKSEKEFLQKKVEENKWNNIKGANYCPDDFKKKILIQKKVNPLFIQTHKPNTNIIPNLITPRNFTTTKDDFQIYSERINQNLEKLSGCISKEKSSIMNSKISTPKVAYQSRIKMYDFKLNLNKSSNSLFYSTTSRNKSYMHKLTQDLNRIREIKKKVNIV